MVVIDTNLLVRYLVKDDRAQTIVATEFLATHSCVLLKTVLLEVVWVLSSKMGYHFSREVVAERIKHLLELPNITVEESEPVWMALRWYEAGLDFADALHLAAVKPQDQFATFDEKLVKKATQLTTDYHLIFLKGEKQL